MAAYKIRSYVNGKSKKGHEFRNYSLAVPSEIAEALPDGITFVPRMTDEGLLYAPVTRMGATLPDWAKRTTERKSK